MNQRHAKSRGRQSGTGVHSDAPNRSTRPAWRERVGHVVDVPPSIKQVAARFGANIDRYAVDRMIFTNSRTDALVLKRSVTRVSNDTATDFWLVIAPAVAFIFYR